MIPPSPTARRVLRSLALHELHPRAVAHPDVHPATRDALMAKGHVLIKPRSGGLLQLTRHGWNTVGDMVLAEREEGA